MKLVEYSEKSVAIFGKESKEIKEDLKTMFKARFNRWLTDPDTGDKTPGWILSKKKLDELIDYLQQI